MAEPPLTYFALDMNCCLPVKANRLILFLRPARVRPILGKEEFVALDI
jgi:hypothetical protein